MIFVTRPIDKDIETVRSFNRFYTARIGALQENLLDSGFSLTEMRVLYELAQSANPSASALTRELDIDAGYLSRILKSFEERGLVVRTPSKADARQNHLHLTETALDRFRVLNDRTNRQVQAMLEELSEEDRKRLAESMKVVQGLLGDRSSAPSYLLRPHQPGDMGWIVYRHGALYAQEHGYNENFEALVAEIVAKFLREFDPKRERCWIAERDGQIVGSVFLVRETDEMAKLRLLLVEPSARGMGIGARLVDECIRFARQAGYRKMNLWTHRDLAAARRIYQNAGFTLGEEVTHRDFGPEQVAETWNLDLKPGA